MRKYVITSMALVLMLAACSEDITGPELPQTESIGMATGTPLEASKLFGVWGATTGTDGDYAQTYRVDFQTVDDGEAVFSHWYTDAAELITDSVYQIGYDYTFDGSTVTMTPKPAAKALGASTFKGVHTGNNQMVLYTFNDSKTDTICTLVRIGDPEPSITGVDRTMPAVGETVTITGRNLQFVDHIFLPAANGGEVEVTDVTLGSKQIQFRVPQADFGPGSIRCLSTTAHVNCYSPAYMFCRNNVFFHSFSEAGTKAPYTGSEFEYSISSMGALRNSVEALSSANLPGGHSLLSASEDVLHPDSLLSFFGNTPSAWAASTSTDPSVGYLRFSSGDSFQRVVDRCGGNVTTRSRCADLAIQMDIYVSSNGEPVWNTGYFSYRLNKNNSINSSMVANVAMWELGSPADFSTGWKTFTIPLSAFTVTNGQTLGALINQLRNSNLETIVKIVNYSLDALHPATSLDSFQFSLANMRLVPNSTPNNTKE